MATQDPIAGDSEFFSRGLTTLQRRWGWLLLLGIVQIICGVVALAVPVAASLAAVIVVGAVLLAAGVFQFVHAFRVRNWKGTALHIVGAVIYTVTGLLVLLFPVPGVLTLTVIVAAMLIADGVVRCVLAYRLKPQDGWGWFLAAGIASVAVGVLLMIGWPLTGFWAIGVLVGVNLLYSGLTHCVLAFLFRSRTVHDADHEPIHGAHRHA